MMTHPATNNVQNMEHAQELIFSGEEELRRHLMIIKAKARLLTHDPVAQKAAMALHGEISDLAKTFFALNKFEVELTSTSTFKIACAEAINRARPTLEKFGWKEILRNLALAILGVGVVYGLACLINKAMTGHFLFFRKDMAKSIDVLEYKIAAVEMALAPVTTDVTQSCA